MRVALLGCLIPALLVGGSPAPALAAAVSGPGERTPLNLPPDTGHAAAPAAPGAGSGIARTIVGLAIVIAVIYGLHWVLKQVKSAKEERASGTGLHSLATLPLGPNRSLALVRAGEEVVLVGVAEGGITPIRTYSESQARDLGLLAEDGEDGQPPIANGGGPAWLQTLRARTVLR